MPGLRREILRSRQTPVDLLPLRRGGRSVAISKARARRGRRGEAGGRASGQITEISRRLRDASRIGRRSRPRALDAVGQWLRKGEPQVFRLFGYAGVGKTTLARHIAEGARGDAAFAAFTGKAALVLRSKGCVGATTIHSLIYNASEGADGAPSFTLNRDGPASRAGLIVIDECSMVDEELGRDLLSFGKPILVLGDPAQLPPVRGGGFFTAAEPDVMLTEIHRQAEDNPIIRLAGAVRRGEELPYGDYGAAKVIRRNEIAAPMVLDADQVLVGLDEAVLLGHRHEHFAQVLDVALHSAIF